jgi:hypothetical protein
MGPGPRSSAAWHSARCFTFLTYVHITSSKVKRAAPSRAATGAWMNGCGKRHGGSRSRDGLVYGIDVLAGSLFLP